MLASPHARPLHPLPRLRERPRRHQGDRAGRGRRAPGLEPRAPRLHRLRRAQRGRPPRRRGRAPGPPPGTRIGARRGRPAGPGRVQPGRVDFRSRVARGAGARAVPDGAAGQPGQRASAPGRRRPDRDHPWLGRRAHSRGRRGGLGGPPPQPPAAGRRRPPPVRARGRIRRALRRPAGVAGAVKFFASCGKGLEYLLADELAALGCARATATIAGVNAEGTLADAQRAVMWSRLASRVLWPLAEFYCADEDTLYRTIVAMPWTTHLAPGRTLAVDARVSGDGITHARYAAQRVKDAVVDAIRAETGGRPDVDLEAPDLLLNLVVRKGRAVLSVDLGGGALHRRGWRRAQGEAPLKE